MFTDATGLSEGQRRSLRASANALLVRWEAAVRERGLGGSGRRPTQRNEPPPLQMPDVRVLPRRSEVAGPGEPVTCWTREQIADMAEALYLRNTILMAINNDLKGHITPWPDVDETLRRHFTGLAVTALDVAARLQVKAI